MNILGYTHHCIAGHEWEILEFGLTDHILEIAYATSTKLSAIRNILAEVILIELSDSTHFGNVCGQTFGSQKFVYAPINGCMQKHGVRRALPAE